MMQGKRTVAFAATVALAAVLVGQPERASAQDGSKAFDDYSVDNREWNGLSQLLELAKRDKIALEPQDKLDFSELSIDQPLVLVFPVDKVDVPNLARFVIAGGRVIVADDFGAADVFLKRLDLDRVRPKPGTLPHDTFVKSNNALPRFKPSGRHPLLVDVDQVVANHPAVLFNVGGPVVPYSGGGGLVYDMNLGRGKVIVIADASLLINHMLHVADNGTLVRNALRYACSKPGSSVVTEDGEARPCTAKLLVKSFESTGHFAGEDDRSPFDKEVFEDLDKLNTAIAEFMEGLPAAQMFFYMGLLLAIGLAIYLYTIFPVRRTRPYSDYIAELGRSIQAPQGEFDWNLTRFNQGSAGINYALPVAILKEIFEELFLDALGLWPSEPGARPDVEELGRIFAVRYLGDGAFEAHGRIEAHVVEVLAEFAQVPSRHRVFLEGDSYYSERDLLKLYARSIEILEIMGLKEDYERRTRSDLIA